MNQRPDADQTTAGARPFAVSLPVLPDGPVLWRSLEELASGGVPAEARAHDPDAPRAPWLEPPSRRDFFRFMAASLALGGVTGCAVQPAEQIVPYVEQPEQIVPGKPLFFSTALAMDGYALGVLVESHMGRPTKIEGNPDHPASLGATDLFAQAAILDFYDPDRSQVVTKDGRVETWVHFQEMLLDRRERKVESRGAGLRILTRPVTSPTLADQLRRLREAFPQMKLHAYEPVTRDAVRAGTKLAFGEDLEPVYHLDQADVIVALDADFFAWGPGRLKDARAFAARREVEPELREFITGRAEQGGPAQGAPAMNRLYAIECTPTITGGSADHRLAVSARDVDPIARAIARGVGVGPKDAKLPDPLSAHEEWVAAVARDLTRTRGRCVVIPGESQPKEVHALAHLMNHALGNVGKTVEYLPRLDEGPTDQFASLRELADDINAERVDTLILLGVNPAYDAPADLKLAELLGGGQNPKVPLKIHLGTHQDETARLCQWHVPEAHALEAWGDVRAFDGTASIQQPLIAPLYAGRSAIEVLANLLGEPDRSDLEIVRDYWRRQALPGDFEVAWRNALRKGVVEGTARKAKEVAPKIQDVPAPSQGNAAAGGLEIVFRPDPSVWDGRCANNGWLQEMPRPMNRLTWDNAAFISEALARRRGIANGDVLELRYRGQVVQMPAWVQPGQAESSVTVFLGHGRRQAGRVGTGVGVDVYPLRTSDAPWFGTGLEVIDTGRRHQLAQTQHHFNMAGRDLVRSADLETYRSKPEFAKLHKEDHWHATEGEPGRAHAQAESLFENPQPQRRRQEGEGNAWGMAINLNTCIGCNACVAACNAENNIPVVGKDQVLASREMHWLRIDRYYEGDTADDPDIHFQPVMCQHCETAPCEIVCPVAATTHSAEGLNEMTYNRCVGTRYCSNNCPYKVRRFNFFPYSDETTPSLKLMRNPDVTVRPRGVMEKCTYCVQRINEARIAAEIDGRDAVGGNEVQTACQAACPTRAIVFGNLNDRGGHVARAKASPRDYGLLADLNTRPRTTYLAKLRNPNPEIKKSPSDESSPRT
jgi:molybdopterin-containing oxidoreductase family iron-sulfur binding subunit